MPAFGASWVGSMLMESFWIFSPRPFQRATTTTIAPHAMRRYHASLGMTASTRLRTVDSFRQLPSMSLCDDGDDRDRDAEREEHERQPRPPGDTVLRDQCAGIGQDHATRDIVAHIGEELCRLAVQCPCGGGLARLHVVLRRVPFGDGSPPAVPCSFE